MLQNRYIVHHCWDAGLAALTMFVRLLTSRPQGKWYMRVAWYLFDIGLENLYQIVLDNAEGTAQNHWRDTLVPSHRI